MSAWACNVTNWIWINDDNITSVQRPPESHNEAVESDTGWQYTMTSRKRYRNRKWSRSSTIIAAKLIDRHVSSAHFGRLAGILSLQTKRNKQTRPGFVELLRSRWIQFHDSRPWSHFLTSMPRRCVTTVWAFVWHSSSLHRFSFEDRRPAELATATALGDCLFDRVGVRMPVDCCSQSVDGEASAAATVSTGAEQTSWCRSLPRSAICA